MTPSRILALRRQRNVFRGTHPLLRYYFLVPLTYSDDPTEVLTHAVDALLSESPAGIDPQVALARATCLLAEAERLQAAAALAVADVDARELWALPGGPGSGGTRTWLRSLPGGEAGQLALGRRLASYAHVRGAVLVGQTGVRSAMAVMTALDQVRLLGEVPEDQLVGVLVHGVPALLGLWCGAGRPQELRSETDEVRTDLAASVIGGCVQDRTASPAARLEPALVLLARALTPAALTDALRTFLDALAPERLEDRERRTYESRSLTLRRRSDGGWDLRALLTDEVGQRLYDVLHRPAPASKDAGAIQDTAGGPAGSSTDAAPPTATEPAVTEPSADGATVTGPISSAPTGPTPGQGPQAGWGPPIAPSWADGALSGAVIDPYLAWPFAFVPDPPDQPAGQHGQVGPGVPPLPTVRWHDQDTATIEGPPELTVGQRAHDALADLLTGDRPTPAALTVTCTLDALTRAPGALPAQLSTGAGPVPIGTEALRRHGCHSTLAAVLHDAQGRPVGASGNHRNATDRERRALHTLWGSTCAVNGCGDHRTVPHHVHPWHLVGRTRLRDLVPLCNQHHHALHDAGRTLRLRNTREITQTGWASDMAVAA